MQTLMQLKKAAGIAMLLLLLNAKYCSAQFAGNINFDGSTQSVVTPSAMMNGATIFTIEFFVKTTESRGNGTYWQRPTMVGSASNYDHSGDFGITTDNGFIGIWSGLNSGGDNAYLSTTKQINDNNWHHIAAVNDGSNIKLYVDGIFEASITSGQGLVTNAAPLTIGASSLDFGWSGNVGFCNFFHQGNIDEVRFSNSVRYSSNFTVPASAFTTDANTVALYHLDGCVSGLVPDASANTNNATPKNLTGSCTFTLPAPPTIPASVSATNITQAEYYYDTDPGFGSGTSIAVSAATDININSTFNVTGLTDGAHRVYVRTKDATGHWSITNNKTFVIFAAVPALPANKTAKQITKAEYFYDTDPGFGNGINIPVTASLDLSGTFAVDLTGLSSGVHYIYVRTLDAAGHWSLANYRSFYILPNGITIPANRNAASITKAEYFVDADPGFGNGKNIPVTAGTDITLTNTFIDLTGAADGVHHVFVRTLDASGHWSITSNAVFSIVAANVTIPANPIPGNITKFEYFFDADPGFGNGQTINVAATTDLNNYTFAADISGLSIDNHTLYIRSYDDWGITITKVFTKGSALPLTWLSFNATAEAADVLLNWKITNQVNNDHFEIERSVDGRTFTKIGNVAAAASKEDYQFTDNVPLDGISYYRIKQVDEDGKSSYSVIVAIRFGKDSREITVYPNPAKDVVNILFDKPQQKNSTIELISSTGQLIQKIVVDGLLSKQLNVSGLASGTYQLRATTGSTVKTQKIIVQH